MNWRDKLGLVTSGWSLLILAFVYLVSRPMALSDHDAAEFVANALTGGIPHPPGYPLYMFLLQPMVAVVPWSHSPEAALSLFSVVCAVSAAAFVLAACRQLAVSSWCAQIAILVVFLSPDVWRQATSIEPWPLHLLLCAVFLWAGVCMVSNKHLLWAASLGGLAMGLAVGHHHQLAFWLPAGLFVLGQVIGREVNYKVVFGAVLGASIGGCSVLLVFLLSDQAPLSWGDWSQPWQRLVIHLFRQEYGTLSLAAHGQASHGGESVVWLFSGLIGQTMGVGTLLMLWGGWVLATKQKAAAIFLLLAFLGSGVLFLGMVNLSDRDVVARFFLQSWLPLAVFLAVGVQQLRQRYLGDRSLKVIVGLPCLVILCSVLASGSYANRRSETLIADTLPKLFDTLPENAVVVTTDDTGYFGYGYLQTVYNLRQDITVVHNGLMGENWYQKRVNQKLLTKFPNYKLADRSVVESLLLVGALVFIHGTPPPLSLPSFPIGPFVHLRSHGAPLPVPMQLLQENVALYRQIGIVKRPDRLSRWESSYWSKLAQPFRVICPLLKKHSQEYREGQQVCQTLGKVWYEDGDYFLTPRS